jgi:hydrogenase maturation factor HypF (carbamoyltransferase family)
LHQTGEAFDAVASLLALQQRVTFEGQAAMELEYVVDQSIEESYQLSIGGRPAVNRQLGTATQRHFSGCRSMRIRSSYLSEIS